MRINWFTKVSLVLLGLLSSLHLFAEKKRPNIIVIVADDLGWADVGFNGCTDIPTPNLDNLASDGVVFSQGYASHPYCSPSRAGILSGRYQQQFGHENNLPYTTATEEDGLPLKEKLLSEILTTKEYETCAIGKWHLGDSIQFWPSNRGFNDWFGFWGGGLSYWGDTGKKPTTAGVLRNGKVVDRNELTYLTDDFSKAACEYIDDYTKGTKPFFMYLAYNAPHLPLQATTEYVNRVQHIENPKRAAYAAMVTGMDHGIGQVTSKLKEKGIYNNTLIIFVSDNGGHVHGADNTPYRGNKGMLFEGGIRVPFLVSYPDKLKGNKEYSEPVSTLDLFPTILEATQVEATKNLDGVSLFSFLNSKKKTGPHNKLYWRYSDGAGYAVREGKYKLVYSGFKQKALLFDIESDPYEQNDLYADLPEVAKQLQKSYQTWNQGNVHSLWQDPHAENIVKQESKRTKYLQQICNGEKRYLTNTK